MAVNPNIASIIAAGYDKIGTMSLQIVHNFDNGYGLSQAQQELWQRLLKTTKIVRILSKFVEFDSDGEYVQVHRLTDTVVNDLLKYLQKVADLDNLPTAPKIFFNGVPVIRFSGGGGGGGSALPNGQIWVGDSTNTAQARTPSGVVTMSNTGVFSLAAGVISNVHINATAAIDHNKMAALAASRIMVTDANGFASASGISTTVLGHISTLTSPAQAQIDGKQSTITGAATTIVSSNLTADRVLISSGAGKVAAHADTTPTEIGYVNGVLSPIQAQINGKQATITGAASTVTSSNLAINKAVVSGAGGKLEAHPNTTLAEIGFVNGVLSPIQTQLNARLSVTLGSLAQGDIIYYNGSAWVNLPRGTNGQALYSTATSIQWDTPTINGIPIGGSLNQVLAKLSGTDFNANWVDLTLAFVTDVNSSAADVNLLQGLDGVITNAELSRLVGVTSPIQVQIDDKQSKNLPNNSIWVGNISGLATALSAGTDGYVLTIVSGSPSWQPASGGGTPPGSDTQVLFNDGGAFGADAGMTYIKATDTLYVSGFIGVGVSSPDRKFHVEQDSATTNAVSYVQRLTSTSSGSPANGIGVGLEFEVETSSGNNEIGSTIEAVTTDVTAASEDFDLVFKTMVAGAAATERARLTSTSSLTLGLGSGDGRRQIVAESTGSNASVDLICKGGGNVLLQGAYTDVRANTAGGLVLVYRSTATNDDPTVAIRQAVVTTTNATVTTILLFSPSSSKTTLITGYIVARRTGGASGTAEDGAAYEFKGVYKVVAGTVTAIGSPTVTVIGEDQAGWDVTLVPSGGNLFIRVTGATNNDITWHLSEFKSMEVGT